MSDNPARRLRMPLDEDVARLPFSPEEVGKLIAACDCICSTDPATTPFIRPVRAPSYTPLLYSGLRIGDVAMLRRSALHETTRYLHGTPRFPSGPLALPLPLELSLRLGPLRGLLSAARIGHHIAGRAQCRAHNTADLRPVIDDKNSSAHEEVCTFGSCRTRPITKTGSWPRRISSHFS
jgi:hypothetical protein